MGAARALPDGERNPLPVHTAGRVAENAATAERDTEVVAKRGVDGDARGIGEGDNGRGDHAATDAGSLTAVNSTGVLSATVGAAAERVPRFGSITVATTPAAAPTSARPAVRRLIPGSRPGSAGLSGSAARAVGAHASASGGRADSADTWFRSSVFSLLNCAQKRASSLTWVANSPMALVSYMTYPRSIPVSPLAQQAHNREEITCTKGRNSFSQTDALYRPAVYMNFGPVLRAYSVDRVGPGKAERTDGDSTARNARREAGRRQRKDWHKTTAPKKSEDGSQAWCQR